MVEIVKELKNVFDENNGIRVEGALSPNWQSDWWVINSNEEYVGSSHLIWYVPIGIFKKNIQASTDEVQKNFVNNSGALKLVEEIIGQVSSGSRSNGGNFSVSPTSSLLSYSPDFLELSDKDPVTATVDKKMYNLEVKFLDETKNNNKNTHKYYKM